MHFAGRIPLIPMATSCSESGARTALRARPQAMFRGRTDGEGGASPGRLRAQQLHLADERPEILDDVVTKRGPRFLGL